MLVVWFSKSYSKNVVREIRPPILPHNPGIHHLPLHQLLDLHIQNSFLKSGFNPFFIKTRVFPQPQANDLSKHRSFNAVSSASIIAIEMEAEEHLAGEQIHAPFGFHNSKFAGLYSKCVC